MATTFDFPHPLVQTKKATKEVAPKEQAPMREAYDNHTSGLGLTAVCAGLGIAVGIISGCALALVHPPSASIANTNSIVAMQANVAAPATIAVPEPALTSPSVSPAPEAASAAAAQSVTNPELSHLALLTATNLRQLAPTPVHVFHKSTPKVAARLNSDAPKAVATSTVVVAKVIPASYEITPTVVSEEASVAPVKAVASFSYEGDLQVVDYDGDAHSIQTSDGRTFVIDATDMANAISLEDNRSDVHFRCAQGGSCMLKARGAAGFEATPLKTI